MTSKNPIAISNMRIPEDRPPGPHQSRAGRQYERDLSLRYLAPGAFTVLPPDEMHQEPPSAPNPYRYLYTDYKIDAENT